MIHDAVWYCNDCKQTFDEPKKNPGHGCVPHDWDSPDSYECPFCGSDDFQIADWCAECDTVHPREKLTWGLCRDCLDKLIREHGHEYIMQDESVADDFAWWWHKRMRQRGVGA